jgi:heavy metal sensor kinase
MQVGTQWTIRTRLTFWYVSVVVFLLLVFAAFVLVFQYVTLTRQIVHDEMQDVATVEGLLYFDNIGQLQLRQDYYSRPQSHLLVDRLMEVMDLKGSVLYRSENLSGQSLGGDLLPGEGDRSFNERILRLKDGTHVLIISHIHGMNGRDIVIRVGYSLRPLRDRMWQFLILLAVALLLTALLAGFTGQWIARKAMSPIEVMANRAEGISAHNLHDRLTVANPQDELGSLAAVFNHLLERLEQSFQQLQRFTADAAHELRTPLASLRTVGEVSLSESHSVEEYRDAISNILEETQRLNHTIDSLLLLARAEVGTAAEKMEKIVLIPLLSEVTNMLTVLAEEKDIRLLLQADHVANLSTRGDRALLRIALINALHNAIKFSPTASTVRISVAPDAQQPTTVLIRVSDEGPGLHGEEFDRVFERFYRGTKNATDKGTGLGLSIVELIVERIDGKVSFDRSVDVGASIVFQLPRAFSQ